MPSGILKAMSASPGDYNLTFERFSHVNLICLDDEVALDHMLAKRKNTYGVTNSHIKG